MPAPRVVRLYESIIPSGNAYEVSLALAHLGLTAEVDVVALDTMATPSETRRLELLAKNPNGRIPLVELEAHPCFTGRGSGVADIALHAHTHSAGEVGFDLATLPALRGWLDRVRAQPGHVPIKPDPTRARP